MSKLIYVLGVAIGMYVPLAILSSLGFQVPGNYPEFAIAFVGGFAAGMLVHKVYLSKG